MLKIRNDIKLFSLISLILILFGNHWLEAQDAVFSQVYGIPLHLNPAFAGTAHASRVSIAYRNQYPVLGSTFVTYNASFDLPVNLLQGGLGVGITNDVQGSGVLNNIAIDGIYSYNLIINPEITVSAGIQCSYAMRFLKTSDFIFPDGIDATTGIYLGPGEDISDRSAGYPDFAVGFLGYTRFWYAGLAVHHLTKPNISFSKNYREPLSRRYTLHAGIYVPLFEKRFGREALRLNPNLVYLQQGSQRQFSAGLEIIRKGLYTGIWMKQRRNLGFSSVMAVAGYQNERFRIGYSYDFNLLKAWSNTFGTGAHELTFSYNFNQKSEQKKKYNAIKCPKI